MARDLHADMDTLRTVLNLAQNRDIEGAAALAEKTLASGFEHPLLLNVIATRLEMQGRLVEALKLLERAVGMAPNDLGARSALSVCLLRMERAPEALQHLDELLKRNPQLAFAHANRGNALIALGALGAAEQSHRRALELEPGNLAATVALASIATQRGDHATARRHAQEALAKAPGFPDAILSVAAADLSEGDHASAERMLQQIIIDGRASDLDRARATSLLGDVLDSAGRYREAFEAYQTSNQALKNIYRRFADSGALAYARSLSQALQRVPAESWRQDSPEERTEGPAEHVFLIGFPRSGTTLLEVVLDGHSQVESLEEHELLTDAVLRYMREPLDLEALARAGDAELETLRASYWDAARRGGATLSGKVFIDKYPLNTLKLALIAKLFPRAKILFAVRDPRDVVLSCFRRRFKMNPAMFELLTLRGAAAFYDAVMAFGATAREVLPLNCLEVRYEQLVEDFEPKMRAVCDFLAIEPSADLAAVAERARQREHATPSTAQLSKGITSAAVAHWRHYQAELAPIEATLKPWVERFGY
ncbi:MAG TPA: sulfotransferase [Steroidobacteraceae bacterium]|jgi:tetratricopeptide (TPR) repeat protein